MNVYPMGSPAAMRFEPPLDPAEFDESPEPEQDEEWTEDEIEEARLEFRLQVLGF